MKIEKSILPHKKLIYKVDYKEKLIAYPQNIF